MYNSEKPFGGMLSARHKSGALYTAFYKSAFGHTNYANLLIGLNNYMLWFITVFKIKNWQTGKLSSNDYGIEKVHNFRNVRNMSAHWKVR